MGNLKGFCVWIGKLVHDKSSFLDPSWHGYFDKSPMLLEMLGRAEAFHTRVAKAAVGGSDPVGITSMRAYRNARKYFLELEEAAGRQGSVSSVNSDIKGDIGKLVKDRESLRGLCEELGLSPDMDRKVLLAALEDAAEDEGKRARLAAAAIQKFHATELENLSSSEAFPKLRGALSKMTAKEDGTIIREALTEEGLAHFSAVVKAFADTEKVFREPAFKLDFDAILAEFLKHTEKSSDSLYQGSFFEAMYDKSYANFRHFLVSKFPPTGLDTAKQAIARFTDAIGTELSSVGIVPSKSALGKFVRDITGGSLANNLLTKALMQMRPINSSLKYFTGAASGFQLAANSLVFNYGNYVTRVVGHRNVYEHPVVDKLLKDMRFLESQGRINGTEIDPDIAATGFNKVVDALTGWIPGKAGDMVRDVMKTGIHAMADWPFDKAAKRVAVMESLLKSKFGQSTKDLDQFLGLLENFDKQSPAAKAAIQRELDALRGNSVIAYDQYFTNSGFAGVSRNFFSDWLPFSALQGYMVKRGADVVRPIRAALEKAVRGDFKEIMKDPEFVRLIAATCYIGKVGAMAGRALEQDDPDEAAKHYALALNDYYQGIEGSFFMRLLTSPIRGWDHSVTLRDAEGEKHTFIDGISGAAYGLLSEAMASSFRELKPLNALSALAAGWRDSGDFGFALNAGKEELDKVLTGMARFNLQEGFETAGLKAVPEPDDWLSYLTMTKGDANKSLAKAIEMRDLESLEKFMEDPKFAVGSLIKMLPVIKHVLDEPSYSGTKYAQYAKALAQDPQLNGMLTSGKLPSDFFSTPDRVTKFWPELTKFDLSKYATSKDGKALPFKEGTHDAMKAELFIDRLAKKMGDGELRKFLSGYAAKGVEAEQLARVLAFAEVDVPGSSRVVLSYVADKMLQNAQAAAKLASGQSKYDKLHTETDDAIKSKILTDLYPMLYQADKTSFAKASVAYLAEKYPAYFQKEGKNVDDVRSFTNAMSMLDMAFVHEFKSGNPSANFVKNLFATTSKYVTNPAHRLDLMNYALSNVDSLPAMKEDKFALKLGILAGNVDNMAAIAKDKVFASNPGNELLLKEGLDIFWKGHAALNDTFRKDGILGAINSDLRSSLGIQSTSKSYGGKPYNQSRGKANDKAYEQYVSRVPAVTKATPSWYKFPQSGGYEAKFNPRSSWDGKPDYAKPQKWDAYVKQLGEARSQNLVTGYVEHFAGDKAAPPYRISSVAPKWRQVAKAKLDMEKVRWKSAKRF